MSDCSHFPEPIKSRAFCIECSRREWEIEQMRGRVGAVTEEDLMRGYRGVKRPIVPHRLRPFLLLLTVMLTACVSFTLGQLWDGRNTRELTVEQAHQLAPLTEDVESRRALAWLLQDKALRAIDALRKMAERDDKAGEHARLYLEQISKEVR